MGKRIMSVQGMDGQIELLTDRVVIRRQGIFNALKYGFNTKREIPLSAISEVAFTDASISRFGEIEFVRGGEHGSAQDGTVRFKKRDQQQFENFKEKVFTVLEQYNQKK